MQRISYQKARKQFARTLNQVCDDRQPVKIYRKNKRSVVLISLRDFESIEETGYLLQSRANAMRLLRAIESLESFTKAR